MGRQRFVDALSLYVFFEKEPIFMGLFCKRDIQNQSVHELLLLHGACLVCYGGGGELLNFDLLLT